MEDRRGILVYSAKFICGVFDPERLSDQPEVEGPVRPGSYTTAINVHNPHPQQVAHFRKRAVLLFEGSQRERQDEFEVPRPPRSIVAGALNPDFGLEIDCADIREQLLGTPSAPGPQAPIFIKGWVVIETPVETPLDVVAVYTAEPRTPGGERPGQGLALEVERVPGTFIPL